MEEDDYVETSDVEELDDVYGQLGAPNHAGVGVGLMAERQLTSGRAPTPESDGHAYETPRKRRKLSHPVPEETRVYAGPSQKSTKDSDGPNLQPLDGKSQLRGDTDASRDSVLVVYSLESEVKMDVDKTPNPEPTTQLPEAPKLDLTRNDESVMRDVKAWASWKSPRIPAGSQEDGHVALSQRSWRGAPHLRSLSADYEGDPLDQIERSLSPHNFSSESASTQEALQSGQTTHQSHGESEDELAAMPPKSTSPLATSQAGSGTSEGNVARGETPLSFPLSPLSPVGSVHSDAEDEDARTVEPREVAPSSRNSVAGTENTENEAMARYPLRRRQPNQLHPYLFDEYQYKTVLKNNPAAIIDVLRLQRRRANQPEDHYEEEYVEEESQQQTSDQNEEVEDQGGRTNPPAEPLPAFIDPLSESEDDSDELAKEARRVEREFRRREREERERERERQREEKEQKRRERERLREGRAARKKPKRFPMNNASAHPESSSHASDNQSPPTSRRLRHSRTPSVPRRPSARSPSPGENRDEFDALRDYFMDDFTMATEDVTVNTADPEPPPERSTPVIIELEDDSPAQASSDNSETESDQELNKRYRELFKLYPPNMARELLEKSKNQRRSRRAETNSPVKDGPLLPGQTRVRKTANPKDIRDIRGDSESEGSETERRSLSPQPLYNGDIRDYLEYQTPTPDHVWSAWPDEKAQEAGPSRPRSHPPGIRHPLTPAPEVIEISDEESSSSSGEEQVDDEDIKTLLGDDDAGIIYDTNTGRSTIKEESMIDWMLSRTRIVGSTISRPKTTKRKRHPSRKTGQPYAGGSANTARPKYKIDVTTRDAHKFGSERQTLLSFANHTYGKKSDLEGNRPKAGMATEPIEIEIQAPEPDRRKSWKERRKERKERAKRQGVYSMANPHMAGITSGRSKKPVKVTVDLNDDDFYQSFAPRSQPPGVDRNSKGKARADPLPPQLDRPTDQYLHSPNGINSRRRLKKRSRYWIEECTIDMGIETLQPGVVFSPTSFIREGHLHNLLEALTPGYIPPRPDPTYLCSLNISHLMDPDTFLRSMDQVFDGLLGLTTDIPSDGYEERVKDWNNLSRSACRHITWHYLQNSENSRSRLESFIRDKVLSIVSSLKSRDIPPEALDKALLSLCWFCIEASVRSGHRLLDGPSQPLDLNPVHASVKLMLHYLLGYGLRKPYRVIQKNQVLDDTKMSCFVAQMWVCLLHLLPICDARQSNGCNKEGPLWSEIHCYYQNLPSANTLEVSEDVWKTVFTLMALSKFSALGIVVSTLRLSASWPLVAYAIKQVQLAQSASNLQYLGQETLEKRDKYISIVVSRCYHLLDYWKWKMDHSFGTLNQLVDIFRARNFVNLRHEKPEYPDFMLNRDWESLFDMRPTSDSAFTSILKLFMRGVDSNCLNRAEVKKMVALIIPVSKFRTQKENIPGVDDLSPICNRFAALALAIAVDPGYATRAVHQVHSSIDFAASDPSTQLLTIRGLSLLASLMIQREVPLQELTKWFTAVVGISATEFKTLKSSGATIPGTEREYTNKVRRYSLLILSLYAAGRTIMETFATKARYPDPAFLLAFKPFFEPDFLKAIEEANCNLCEMRRFIESFLEARVKYLPLPEPTIPSTRVDDPDSQDYGNFDFGIDLNDPSLLAQLEGQGNSFAAIREQEKSGELLQKIIFPCFWVSRRKIQRFCEAATDPVVDQDTLRTLDSWARCLVGCMHILIQHDTLHDWAFCLKEITPLWQGIRVTWLKRRVQLVLYLEILRHDPSVYASKSAEMLELLFESLAYHRPTVEPRFWRLVVLHETAANPLFKDAAETVSDPPSGGESQMSLLRVLFKNIDTDLQEMHESSSRVAAWINLCLKLLSTMRSISQEFMSRSEENAGYNTWCKDVLAQFDHYPLLKHHQRLKVILDLISRTQ